MAERETPKQRVKELIVALRERVVEHIIAGLNPGAKGEAAPYRASVKRAEAALLAEFEGLTAQREAAQALITALDACTPFINSAFMQTYGLGTKYTGPTYGKELDALRALSPTESREHP